jgi:hypothetical protein
MATNSPEICDQRSLSEHYQQRKVQTLLAVGATALAFASIGIKQQEANASPSESPQPVVTIASGNTDNINSRNMQTSPTAEPSGDNDECTTLRFDGLYITKGGQTCKSHNASATTIDDGYPRFGWIYAAVYIDGVTKCAYIKPDVLPEREPARGVITACRKYLNDIRSRRYIQKPNCGDINGVDACIDGVWDADVSPGCKSNGIAFAQFATRKKSPWNVFGVKAPTFSRPISEKEHDKANYRGLLAVPGEHRRAITVRTSSGWGVMPSNCVKEQYGGTCKNKRKTKDEHGNTVCGSSDKVKEDAKKWRKIRKKNVQKDLKEPIVQKEK